MTLYEKVIEDVHVGVDESVLREDLIAALQSDSIKEDEVKYFFELFYTKQLIDLPLLKECVNLFVCKKRTLIFKMCYVKIEEFLEKRQKYSLFSLEKRQSNKQNLSPDRNTQSALSCIYGENRLHLQ